MRPPWLHVTVPANAAPVCPQIANITAYASLDTIIRCSLGVLSDYTSCRSDALPCRLVAPARLVGRGLRIEPRRLHEIHLLSLVSVLGDTRLADSS